MRRPPPLNEAGRYPVVTATSLLAIAATLAWWSGVDMTPFMESADIRRGELWRLVTSSLFHVNFIHLGFNLYWLWVFGTLVEQMFGHVRTAALLILLAATSGAAEFALLEGGVGLSGVGYGLFGMLWVLSRRDRRFAGAVDQQTIGLFVVWFFICIVTTYMGLMNVGNMAHGSGAIFGALVGLAIVSRQSGRVAVGAAMGALAIACIVGATVARPFVNFSKSAGQDEAYFGYRALAEDRNAAAVRWLRDATRMNPKDAGSWYNLGIAHERLGRTEDAREAFARALQLDPGNEKFQTAVSEFESSQSSPPPGTTQGN